MMILLVEDDALIAMTLEAALADQGYTVRGPASTAERALQLCELSRPDLALVDINLRDGNGRGIDLARELLSRWGVPSLFVSGQQAQAQQNKDAALGYISKPYTMQTVIDSIEVAMAIATGRRFPPPKIPHGLEVFAPAP